MLQLRRHAKNSKFAKNKLNFYLSVWREDECGAKEKRQAENVVKGHIYMLDGPVQQYSVWIKCHIKSDRFTQSKLRVKVRPQLNNNTDFYQLW